MKKLFVLLLLLFTTDSFASGISGSASTAPCDNDTLSKYTGTANVEINWEPNVINLKWYDGDTEINVANTSQTCTYDGMITVPPQPTKPGYTFNGWKIPKIDFATIPTNAEGLERWGKGNDGGEDFCRYDTTTSDSWTVACNSDSNFNELQQHEWKVKFDHGFLYGTSTCSATGGSMPNIGTPSSTPGNVCWCKAIGYRAINSNVINKPTTDLSWVCTYDGRCEMMCAARCMYCAGSVDGCLNSLFTPAQ